MHDFGLLSQSISVECGARRSSFFQPGLPPPPFFFFDEPHFVNGLCVPVNLPSPDTEAVWLHVVAGVISSVVPACFQPVHL